MSEELSDSQRRYWEQQLEYARKAVEVAERTLGITAVEQEVKVEETDEHQQSNEI